MDLRTEFPNPSKLRTDTLSHQWGTQAGVRQLRTNEGAIYLHKPTKHSQEMVISPEQAREMLITTANEYLGIAKREMSEPTPEPQRANSYRH